MIDTEKSASARLPAANVWLGWGESLARTAAGVVWGILRWLQRRLSSLERSNARRASLRELYRMDDRLLKDIGLRRDQVAEFVDGMLHRTDFEAVTGSTRKAVTVGLEDTTEVTTDNEGQYRSAA
jgi:uncharacterized protein YjiS (DUF1127 family)